MVCVSLNTVSSKFILAMWDLLERGGVIGGTSAGAAIQGDLLLRGDTATNQILMARVLWYYIDEHQHMPGVTP